MLISSLILLGSLVLLVAGAELLVRGATGLALRLGISPLFVGLTIVGFGTSTPELAASLTATLRGSTGLSVGNVIGSNLFNIGVILGIAALIRPIAVEIAAVRRDLAFMVAAGAAPLALALAFDTLPRWTGVALLAMLAVSIAWAAAASRRAGEADTNRMQAELADAPAAAAKPARVWPGLLFVAAGLAMLAFGSSAFVSAAVQIARTLGMSELIIGLTIVAAGTSMPELLTSAVAAIRRSSDIAVGNIVGSNIFNVFGILGVCAIAGQQDVARQTVLLDAPAMLLLSVLIVPLLRSGARLSRAEGVLLLAVYAVYLGLAIWWGVSGGI